MAVARSAEQSLLTPEICSLNPVISNCQLLLTVEKIQRKEPMNGPIKHKKANASTTIGNKFKDAFRQAA